MMWVLNWDTGRWFNAVLAACVVIIMIIGTMLHWDEMPKRVQRIAPWVIITYVIIAYGSGTLAAHPGEVPPGYRVGAMMLNLVGLLISLLWRFGDGYVDPVETGPTMDQSVSD